MRFTLLAHALAATALLAACARPAPAPDAQQRLDAALRSRPVVLLGEVHDNAAQHALRARALRTLLEGGARPALAMEQFDRERQPEIDRALARAGVTPEDVIAAGGADGRPMAGWSWPLYRPYIALAIEYRLPLIAANVSRSDTRRIFSAGLAASGFDAQVPPDIAAAQANEILEGHCGMIDAAQANTMVGAQSARDQFMARVVEAHAAQGVVLLAGDGHVRRDVGVPRWLTPATRARSLSIGLIEGSDADAAKAFDVVIATPAQQREDPCAEFRQQAASAPRG